MPVLESLDRHPVRALIGFSAVTFAGLELWSHLDDAPTLLARLDPDSRGDIYGQLAGSAVAMLAVALTVLAILVSLPDRARIQQLREQPSWHLVESTLLAAAGYSLLTLILAHVAAGVDGRHAGLEWLEHLVVATAVTAVVAILVGGTAFALVIHATHQPADPSAGRGEGPA